MATHNLHVDGIGDIEIEVKKADDGEGYSIAHKLVGNAEIQGVSVTCSCGDGTSTTRVCPTASYTCNCPNARITCG